MTKIDEKLFVDEHYLGRPADLGDKIVSRRINLLHEVKGFTGKNLDLIEIGCGNGASIALLADHFNTLLGTDINNDHEKDFYIFNQEHKNTKFEILNIEERLPDRLFDRLISFEVIEHLRYEESVAQFAKCLKPGGQAIISVPNRWWIFEIHGAKIPGFKTRRVPFLSWMPRWIHEPLANARIYSKNRIKKLMEKCGFEVVSCKYVTAPLDVLQESAFKKFMTTHFFGKDETNVPIMGVSVLVHAKKRA